MSQQPVELKGTLSVTGVVMITVSGITPASSIYVIAPLAIASAGSGSLISFLLGAVIACGIALCYSELGAAYPSAGGSYIIAQRVFGDLPGILAYLFTIGSTLFIPPVLAVGAIPYLNHALGTHFNVAIAGMLTTLVGGLLGLVNIRTNALVTGIFLLIEVVILSLIAILGYSHPHQSVDILIHPLMLDASGQMVPASLGIMVAMVGTALFCYDGYGLAVTMAEDMTHRGRPMAKAVMFSLLVVVVLELVPFAALLIGAPSLETLTKQADPISYVLGSLGGETTGRVVGGVIFLSVFNAIIALAMQCSRMLFSSGRDNFWFPWLNRALRQISPRTGTPWFASLLFSIISALLALNSGLEELASFNVILMLLVYSTIGVAALFSRRKRQVPHPYLMPLWPLPALVALAGCLYVLITLLSETSLQDYMIVLGLALVGVMLHVYHRRSAQPVVLSTGDEKQV